MFPIESIISPLLFPKRKSGPLSPLKSVQDKKHAADSSGEISGVSSGRYLWSLRTKRSCSVLSREPEIPLKSSFDSANSLKLPFDSK